jgi:rsbT co-antagonist protein RsbR
MFDLVVAVICRMVETQSPNHIAAGSFVSRFATTTARSAAQAAMVERMRQQVQTIIPALIEKHHQHLLGEWLACQKRAGASSGGQVSDAALAEQSRRFLTELRQGAAAGYFDDLSGPEWDSTRALLETVGSERAVQGFSSTETALFVFSLKQPLFELLRRELGDDAPALARETWTVSLLLDKLGLHAIEVFQRGREEVIRRQQEELLELSTPVIQLWDGVLALPLIGTLDSARTQTVMESLLERIVTSGAEVAIIDITGVPTVDTLVAQHLIKTVSAARLMGADCIISGIRPQIAQTIVHLGLELNVVSKATMADALALALRRLGKAVLPRAAKSSGE